MSHPKKYNFKQKTPIWTAPMKNSVTKDQVPTWNTNRRFDDAVETGSEAKRRQFKNKYSGAIVRKKGMGKMYYTKELLLPQRFFRSRGSASALFIRRV